MKKLTIRATLENIETVICFVSEQLETVDCPPKTAAQINIAVDEIFSNIARYAYTPNTGDVTVCAAILNEPSAIVITFIDSGIPYNPLDSTDPDTTLSAEKRKIGGLGIYMVKKIMSEISYEYKNGQNILQMKKDI